MKNKAQSQIITTVLIILLVIAAILIIYQVVEYTLNSDEEHFNKGKIVVHNNGTKDSLFTSREDLNFTTSSSELIVFDPNPPQFIARFSPDYKNVTINLEICEPVTCECAKNTDTPCMAMCFYCDDEGD